MFGMFLLKVQCSSLSYLSGYLVLHIIEHNNTLHQGPNCWVIRELLHLGCHLHYEGRCCSVHCRPWFVSVWKYP